MREEPSLETYRGAATPLREGLSPRVLGLSTETTMHWTQDPANAKKLSAARKRAALTRAMNRKAKKPRSGKRVAKRASTVVVKVDAPTTETVQHEQKESTATAIAYSHCDAYIQVLADTFGLSRSTLADRVGEALREQAARR